jgi:hypothetical protein
MVRVALEVGTVHYTHLTGEGKGLEYGKVSLA